MNNRIAGIMASLVISVICIGIFITNNYSLLGFLLGFLTGLINVKWLFNDSQKAVNEEITAAIRRYQKGLFSRLGMVTMVVAVIGRFQPDWLFFLALGIAAGVIIPLIMVIKQQISKEGGEQ